MAASATAHVPASSPPLFASSSSTIRTYTLSELTAAEVKALMARPRVDFSSIVDTVRPIVDAVRDRGDAALSEFTARFDGVNSAQTVVRVAVRARVHGPPPPRAHPRLRSRTCLSPCWRPR